MDIKKIIIQLKKYEEEWVPLITIISLVTDQSMSMILISSCSMSDTILHSVEVCLLVCFL